MGVHLDCAVLLHVCHRKLTLEMSSPRGGGVRSQENRSVEKPVRASCAQSTILLSRSPMAPIT